MKLTKSWKIFLISLGCVLFLGLIGGGVYVYLKDPFGFKIPKLDKYSDIENWCEYTTEDGNLEADCKALLLDITTDGNGNSCFDMLVITKDKELKDLTVCEPMDTLTYTNEVLDYKKLMPLDVTVNYTNSDLLNNYSFSNVSFEAMDEEYIHSIVNEDIANLVQTDVESATTIKNSVNFCPQPDRLPSYITGENHNNYEIFYNLNKLQAEMFGNGGFYDITNDSLQISFGCKSQVISGYMNTCYSNTIDISEDLSWSLSRMSANTLSTKELTSSDIETLKYLSIFYDGEQFIHFTNTSEVLSSLINSLNLNMNINENIYCSMYSYLRSINSTNNYLQNRINFMTSYINQNIEDINSGLCLEAVDMVKTNTTGYFLKIYFNELNSNNLFAVLNKCISLNMVIK